MIDDILTYKSTAASYKIIEEFLVDLKQLKVGDEDIDG